MLFDMSQLTPPERYKVLASSVVPRPIAWITTISRDGVVNAAPFSFFNMLSGDPPVLGVGIGSHDNGSIKDTGANIRATGQFVVNLVSHNLADRMNVTAVPFASGVDELARAGLTPAPCAHVAPPRIEEAPVSIECERLAIVEIANERAIVLGRCLAVHVQDALVLDATRCLIDTPALDLIGRMHGGGWYCRTTHLFEMPRLSEQELPPR